MTKIYEEYIRTDVKNIRNIDFSQKGEATVVISEGLEKENNLKELKESDKKKIDKLFNQMSVKDIVNELNKSGTVSKKLIYNYCLKKKNEI